MKSNIYGDSLIGRTSISKIEGMGSSPWAVPYADVAQQEEAIVLEAIQGGFESLQPHQKIFFDFS